MPRAFLVGDYTVETNNEKIMQKILSDDFDFRTKVILEKNPNIPVVNEVAGNAEIVKYSPNTVEIKANTDNESILVLSDSFYPGWKVKVNGKEKEILRANYSFRGVVVPKGNSGIKFYYFPESFKYGIYLFVSGLVLIFIFLAGKWYTTSKWNKHKTAKYATK